MNVITGQTVKVNTDDKTPKILYASNNASSQLLVQKLFAGKCIVDPAFDGIEAMWLIGKNNYSLVMADYMLKHVNGFDVLNNLKEQKGRNFPVLLLSSVKKSEVLQEYPKLNSKVDEVIMIPFERDYLVPTVLNYINGYSVNASSNL
ncbi:MAG: response regulator [Candidatus Micrarchaeia archaeon]